MADPVLLSYISSAPTDALVVRFRLTPAYSSSIVSIRETWTSISIPLTPGPQVITTELQDVGHIGETTTLQASLSLWCEYNTSRNKFTFCSNDLVSPDSTYLTTVPELTNECCRQYTYDIKPAYTTNAHWNVFTPLTPGLEAALRLAVRCANQSVINAAKQVFNVTERTPPKQALKSRWLVFQGGLFQRFYPEKLEREFHKEQSNDRPPPPVTDNIMTLLNCSVVFVGRSTWQQSAPFSSVTNAIPSPPSGTWYDWWTDEYGAEEAKGCASQGYEDCADDNPVVLCGGHVFLGSPPANVQSYADNIFIMPICPLHRTNGVMQVTQDNRGIDLNEYILCAVPAPILRTGIGTAERSLRSHL
jgi:hypothetical protein